MWFAWSDPVLEKAGFPLSFRRLLTDELSKLDGTLRHISAFRMIKAFRHFMVGPGKNLEDPVQYFSKHASQVTWDFEDEEKRKKQEEERLKYHASLGRKD